MWCAGAAPLELAELAELVAIALVAAVVATGLPSSTRRPGGGDWVVAELAAGHPGAGQPGCGGRRRRYCTSDRADLVELLTQQALGDVEFAGKRCVVAEQLLHDRIQPSLPSLNLEDELILEAQLVLLEPLSLWGLLSLLLLYADGRVTKSVRQSVFVRDEFGHESVEIGRNLGEPAARIGFTPMRSTEVFQQFVELMGAGTPHSLVS